jgi:hypothetical protein
MKVAVMPVIKIFSAASPARPPNQGGHVAAAVMAKTLAAASEPLKPHEHRKRLKAERTRPKNPNSLTLNQHVFPSRSIERFTDQGGCVSVTKRPDNASVSSTSLYVSVAQTLSPMSTAY